MEKQTAQNLERVIRSPSSEGKTAARIKVKRHELDDSTWWRKLGFSS